MTLRRAALAASLVAATAQPAHAFSPLVHQRVTLKAIDTLPKPLKEFYKDHRYEMPTLAVDAVLPPEGPERRFAVDRVVGFPFLDLPRDEATLAERLEPGAPSLGRLPWLIDAGYARLVQAFRSGDKRAILEASDALAGYVTDFANPLALTRNFDGQLTEQHGLWVRFSERLPEAMDRQLDLKPDAAHYLDRPGDYVYSMLSAAYVWIDNLLYHEELARRGKAGYTTIYYDDLIRRAGPILQERLSSAAGDVGSYWYTAWTEAGRPALE